MPQGSANSRETAGERSSVSPQSHPKDIDGTQLPISPPVSEPEASPGYNAVAQTTAWQKVKVFYWGNVGLFFVLMAQIFASLMSTATRLLETGFETKFHALQIIFVRMLSTAVLGSLYMWYKKVPDFPFGNREVRGLLVLRGMAGFLGLFAAYYSLSYLNLADATVITFLTPTLTAFIAFLALREPFTKMEAMAGVLAFTGVLIIAQPSFLFRRVDDNVTKDAISLVNLDHPSGLIPPVPVTAAERAIAVVCAVLGTLGGAIAYTTIRVIGERAHSLVSVNYFAALATLGSCLIILIYPNLQFEIPQTLTQWLLLVSIGVAGFLLQLLLTEGLKREKAGRATNLIYTQMVFALVIERVVWGTTPSKESLFGSALILASAVWISLQKSNTPAKNSAPVVPDEETTLLGREAT